MVGTKRELFTYFSLLPVVAFYCIEASNVILTEGPVTKQCPIENTVEEYFGKHEDFVNCTKFCFEQHEYVIYPNATVYVKDYKRNYTEECFLFQGDLVMVCVPKGNEISRNDPTHAIQQLTAIGNGVSAVCLLIHLVLFALLPEKQNLPGYNLASLSVSFLFGHLSMIVSEHVRQNCVVCMVVGAMTQFFLMASFLWMFVIAFDILKSIHRATSSLRVVSTDFRMKKFLCNSLIAWGVPLIFSAAAMIADNIEGIPKGFEPQFHFWCWFNQKQSLWAFFGGPVMIVFHINFVIFGISAYKIFSNRMKSSTESQQSNLKKSHIMYFRLGIIMGVTRTTGMLAQPGGADWLWYLYATSNAFQGFFIFVAFTCTGKVRKYLKNTFFGEKIPTKSSTLTLTT